MIEVDVGEQYGAHVPHGPSDALQHCGQPIVVPGQSRVHERQVSPLDQDVEVHRAVAGSVHARGHLRRNRHLSQFEW
jgi:hypothetical protein